MLIKGELMKKILISTLILSLSLVAFAQGNKQSKWQQDLRKRNDIIIHSLQNMGRSYNTVNNAEVKEKIASRISMEVERWCMSNTPKIISFQQRQQIMQTEQKGKKGQKANNSFSKKDMEKVKQEIIAEVKNGKIPEIMLKTASQEFARKIRLESQLG